MSSDSLLADVLIRMFRAHELPRDGRAGTDQRWYQELWDDLAAAGMPWVSLPEIAGGSGGTVTDAFEMLRLVGAYAAPVPLAETSLLGGWMLVEAGLSLPNGALAVVADPETLSLERDGRAWRLAGAASRVPFGGEVETVVALCAGPDGPVVVRAPVSAAEVRPGTNLAGEPLDELIFHGASLSPDDVAAAPASVTCDALRRRGAATRAVMMSGAIDTIESMTIAYAHDRHQFGRPIATFQAVQHRLVRIAEEALVARMAVALAVRAFETGGSDLEIAAAKAMVGDAATEVAAHAHQVHGAIGMTKEYVLHPFTRRLWTWRQQFGSSRHWHAVLGRQAIANRQTLWPFLADGLAVRSDTPRTAANPTVMISGEADLAR